MALLSGCGGIKVVRIPIPIPTFGIGSQPKQAPEPKTAYTAPSEQRASTSNVIYGVSSWYGQKFHGRRSASGERYNMYALTAAHRTLPFDTKIRVTNLDNGKSCILRINDRGPFVNGRVLDVSYESAKQLDFVQQGLAQVKIEIL